MKKINLQLFADGEGDAGIVENPSEQSGQGADASSESGQEQPKTYTQDEVEKLKQELSQEKERQYQQSLQEAIKSAIDEEKRKAKLPKDKLEQEEKQKLLDEIESLKNEKMTSELKEKALIKLTQQSLPNTFLNFVMGADEKAISDNITSLKAEFDKAVQSQVEQRLKGKTPTSGGNAGASNAVEVEFEKALGI